MPDVQTLADLSGEPHATVFADAPRTVRLSLAAGESLPEHDHPGVDVLLVGLEGHLTVEIDGEPYDVRENDVLRVAGERRIEPRAREDSTALVILAPREGDDA